MGSSGNWLKLFIPHRKSNPIDQVSTKLANPQLGGKRPKKWKLWRSSSSSSESSSIKRGQVAASVSSDSPVVEDVYSAAMATLVRAPPKDFLIIRQEWASIRIQTAFRALLARRAFRALKALVRLQAIVRGRLVRKRAALTLKCMQALVRAQAQVKAHRVRMSLEGESMQKKVENQSDPVKQTEGKLRQEAAIKRDRGNKKATRSNSLECDSIRGTKNYSTRRVNSKEGSISYCSSSSQPSSRVMNTESSFSSSTFFEGTTEDSASSASVSISKPRYMNLTASNRAKQREGGITKSRFREASLRLISGEVKRISVDSGSCFVAVTEDLCPPKLSLDRYEWNRCR